MTSLMDIFTVLLLFLLKSFVADPQVMTPHPDVKLPVSESQTSPEESPVVVVSQAGILLADMPIAGPEVLTAAAGNTIPALGRRLDAVRQQTAAIRVRRGDDASAPYRLTVQGDLDLSFAALERVLRTAHMAGYAEISLATRKN